MNNLPNENTLKVLTLNVGALAPFGKLTKPQTVKRVEEICRQFEKSSYDVILLQEVWTQGYRRRLNDCGFPFTAHAEKMPGLIRKKRQGLSMSGRLKLIANMASALLPDTYGFDKGLMILSRFPLEDIRSMEFDENGEVENAFEDGEFPVNKGALMATITHPKLGKVRLVNTHLVSQYKTIRYDQQRANQLRDVFDFAQTDFNEESSLIVGGDFNMSPPGPQGQPRRYDTDLVWRRLRESLLEDFVQADLPYENLTTFPDHKSPQLPNLGVLDHLFSKGNLAPLKGGVVFKEKIPCGKKTCFVSDHYGFETVYTSIQNPENLVSF